MDYLLNVIILVSFSVMLSASFNLIIGHGGLISIAHPIFYAIGAYFSAILSMQLGWPIWLTVPCGALFAAAVSAAVALPSLRVSGDYLLIASIGFQLGLLHTIEQLDFLGGPGGLGDIPAIITGQSRSALFAGFIVLLSAGVVLLIHAIMVSDYGRAVQAMRDDEVAFVTLGRNPIRIKIGIFALGSGIAGLAGALYAHFFQYVSPEQFGIMKSAMILTMVIVGGMNSTLGPVVGALILVALPEMIAFLDLSPAIMGPVQGILFTGLVLVFLFLRPEGIVAARKKIQAEASADE